MRFGLLGCVALLVPVAAFGQPNLPGGPVQPGAPMIPASADVLHFCYYAGKPYSEGAIIKDQSGRLLECSENRSNVFNTNGKPQPLEWQSPD